MNTTHAQKSGPGCRKPLMLLLGVLLLSACASTPSPATNHDPLERVNRPVYRFNDMLDRAIIKPAANIYVAVTPSFARRGVTNFFDNAHYLNTIVNDFLQGKARQGMQDTARFVFNSTFGLAGLIDVATPMGLEEHQEDFGQTLAVWGVPNGAYLMLPGLGPNSVRDTPGTGVWMVTDLTNFLSESWVSPWFALYLVNSRANLGEVDKALEQSFDPYVFVREAYVQQRNFLIFDGSPPEPADDDIDELLEEEI